VLLAMQRQVTRLVQEWKQPLADSIAAMNLLLDESGPRRAAAIEQMSNAVGGNCKAVGQLWAENALRGVWRMQCANGALSVGITLAPTEPARVQQFTVVPMRADAVLGPAPLCRP
jgi:hypothetical protein